jgi:metallo-beta-lactamase family protein
LIKLKFLGAAGTVTGSKFFLQLNGFNILVDCGLFQGLKYLRNMNREPLPVDISGIDALIITHAHLDHTGYLPLLVRNGYKGPVYLTEPTADLAEIVLKDSAKIQEEDASKANKEGYSKHSPALPLYTEKDALETFKLFRTCEDNKWISLVEGIKFRFKKNGHILGSCFVEIDYKGKIILFSGDIGKKESVILNDPLLAEKAEVLLIESTYGNRTHPEISPEDQLTDIIKDTFQKKGNILISSFAIGRAQELIFLINKLIREKRIPNIPVYLDSPMSSEATKILFRYPPWHKLSYEECEAIVKKITFVKSVDDSFSVIHDPSPKIIVAASGMLAGGRILNYLKEYIEDRKNTILLVGYQAEGTRGKTLKDGGKEIKIHGKFYRVNAEVREISTLSAHADQKGLMEWISSIKSKPGQIFLIHGENDALSALRQKIWDDLGLKAIIPSLNEEYEIFL